LFDIKHSPGGMMDVEFAVQYLVLSEAARYPELVANAGNIALLHIAQVSGLLPPAVGDQAGSAYRELRRLQHRARLDETPARVSAQELPVERAAVLALWRYVFESDPKA
jgi:glutamate-ammonia-ligase adenylyltransferase